MKKKLKICVYAISKNEEKFVKRWYHSMKEADNVYVLDTGSQDNTVSLLKECGVIVSCRDVTPWRFDVARNLSLDMIPEDADICVCTDLDEVFEKGWRKKLENSWKKNVTRAAYNYNWSFDEYNHPKVNFYIEKIHSRHHYQWKHPVHEVLEYCGSSKEEKITLDNITLNHYPDSSKSRSSYLSLLELSVQENPDDDRNVHYLGREYMYYQKWNEAIDTLIRHLSLPNALWKDERSASMRFIARSYAALKRYDEAKMWLEKAMIETPYLRDPFVERALLEYHLGSWKKVRKYALKALRIKKHTKSYINEPFSWDYTVYDLLSLSHYFEQNIDRAIFYVKKALKIAPNNTRLLQNLKLMREQQKKEKKNI